MQSTEKFIYVPEESMASATPSCITVQLLVISCGLPCTDLFSSNRLKYVENRSKFSFACFYCTSFYETQVCSVELFRDILHASPRSTSKYWKYAKKFIDAFLLGVNFSLEQATKTKRESRCIALLFLQPRRYMWWVVNATPRPLYPQVRSGTHYIWGWVDPSAGLDWRGKSRPHRDSIPGPSSP